MHKMTDYFLHATGLLGFMGEMDYLQDLVLPYLPPAGLVALHSAASFLIKLHA